MSRGFASGGIVGENMYKGVDYLMSEMTGNEGGIADVPDTTKVQTLYQAMDTNGFNSRNVRDDIPSIQEGEIVVPADVVNYHGVNYLRN